MTNKEIVDAAQELLKQGKIQYWSSARESWMTAVGLNVTQVFRIKPEPMVVYINVYPSGNTSVVYRNRETAEANASSPGVTQKFVQVLED